MEMKEKNIGEKNTKRFWVLKNLIGAIIFFVVLAIVANILLGIFTNHNRTVVVPDMTNMSVAQAQVLADSVGVRIDVVDSIYVRGMAKGAVRKQNPAAGSNVKSGRRILLTINSIIPKKVTMPNLVGYSMRQAKAELNSKALYLGKLIYVNDIATNNVLHQQYRGRDIAAGSSIESGSTIDLVVGLDGLDNRTYVPNVMGMKYDRALDVVHDNSLNVSKVVFDASVRNYNDTINSVVYRQSPAASQAPMVIGSDVSIYLTVDPERIPK